MIRFRLIPALALMSAALAVTVPAQAQDKGSVNPKPLPPLANPNDPNVAAKELFGRKLQPAALAAADLFDALVDIVAGKRPTSAESTN